jgi:uncharacterized Zn-binding protein involved in type VI secretion
MPRLVGKPSNGSASLVLLLLVAIGAAGAVEYAGVVDLVPQFGKDYFSEPGPVESDGQPGVSQNQMPAAEQGNQYSQPQNQVPQPSVQPGN